MNLSINKDVLASLKEATRLTQSGQLQEATALIQRALNGEPGTHKSAEPVPFKGPSVQGMSDRTTAGQGETLEGSFEVVNEQPKAKHKTSARQNTAQPDQAHSTKPRQAFTAHPNISGLGDLLRGKLAGLQGLNTAVSPAAEALPEGATFNSGTFANQAGSRDYKLYIPSGYNGQRLPLVVMLHGCTQNPDDFAAGTGMNALAEAQPCLVLYPAQTASANQSRCWNWFKPSDQGRNSGEPAIIAGMTQQIIDEYKLDERRVYIAGLSAGGAMATTLAMTWPELYAAVGVHSGLPHGAAQDLPSALAAMRGSSGPLAGLNKQGSAGATASTAQKIPAIIFHGDRDTTVHPSNGDLIAAQYLPSASSDGAAQREANKNSERGKVTNGHDYTRTIHNDGRGQPVLEQWSVHGAGHAWAGGSTRGSYTDPKGPDASAEMLRFFLAHSNGDW